MNVKKSAPENAILIDTVFLLFIMLDLDPDPYDRFFSAIDFRQGNRVFAF